MVIQHQPNMNTRAMQVVLDEMRRSIDRGDHPPVEVSEEAGLVSVVMDEHLKVRAISLHSLQIGTEEAARLEAALVEVYNKAVGEIARRRSERLRRALAEADSYLPPEN